MGTAYTDEERQRIAEIDAELAPFVEPYNELLKKMRPLWSERKRLIKAPELRALENLKARKCEYAARELQVGLKCLALAADGFDHPQIEEAAGEFPVAMTCASLHILRHDPGHELLPIAIKYWTRATPRLPTIHGVSGSEVARIEEIFVRAGCSVKKEKVPVLGDAYNLEIELVPSFPPYQGGVAWQP